MKFSDFKIILHESVTSLMGGQKSYGDANVKNASEMMRNFGEGAAVFVADKLAFFGDVGAARADARAKVSSGIPRTSIRVERIRF